MAAVYSKKQSRRRTQDGSVAEQEHTSPPDCGTGLSAGGSSSAGRAGSPAPQAREHAEVAASSAAVPQIRIKEEPVEEGEYLTVHVDDESGEEQASRGERADGKRLKRLLTTNKAAGGPPEHRARTRAPLTCLGHSTHPSLLRCNSQL